MNEKFSYDVAYVGNDIKGRERTEAYLYPALKFNFGLFGKWSIPKKLLIKSIFSFWYTKNRIFDYQIEFARISKGKIPQEDVPVLYSSSRINLNCTLQDCVNWDVITLRTYEILACRGFLISDKVPSAEKKLKNMVVFTEGSNDLISKITYFLERADEREQIADRGYKYVVENETLSERMNRLMDYLLEV
jgi:spore maturation protein CgeB